MKKKIKTGTKVRLLGGGQFDGVVVGRTTDISERGGEWFYIVALKEGFYNEDHNLFTSLLVVHQYGLELV